MWPATCGVRAGAAGVALVPRWAVRGPLLQPHLACRPALAAPAPAQRLAGTATAKTHPAVPNTASRTCSTRACQTRTRTRARVSNPWRHTLAWMAATSFSASATPLASRRRPSGPPCSPAPSSTCGHTQSRTCHTQTRTCTCVLLRHTRERPHNSRPPLWPHAALSQDAPASAPPHIPMHRPTDPRIHRHATPHLLQQRHQRSLPDRAVALLGGGGHGRRRGRLAQRAAARAVCGPRLPSPLWRLRRAVWRWRAAGRPQ
jgi:hypothetical protein